MIIPVYRPALVNTLHFHTEAGSPIGKTIAEPFKSLFELLN